MSKHLAIVCAAGLFITGTALADTSYLEQPPVIPPPLADGESIEPEITIIQQEDRTIEEYRVNGQLYMIKVTPSVGPSYYLMDTDGDGRLETRRHELDSKLLVPNWILFEW